MITQLRTLIAVARFGTFSAAGDKIGLTQAAVSGHIKRLEDELGFELFDRTGRSATLNAAGLRTLERAKDLVADYEALKTPESEAESGLIRLGAIYSMQPTIVPRAMALFRKKYPRRRVHIVPGVSLNLIDMTDGAELDLALVIRPSFGIPKSFSWRPLIEEPFMLAVPSTAVGDDWMALLQERPFIRYEKASLGGRYVERFLQSRGIDVEESFEADDIAAMLQLVGEGLGVAIFPATQVCLPLPPTVRAISLGSSTFHREIGLLTQRKDDPVVDHMAACIAEAAAEFQPTSSNQTKVPE